MEQIQIREDVLPILKAGVAMQKKLTDIKAKNYFDRLIKFEKKYNMSSDLFIREFEAGNLGDETDWFDWLFVYDAWKKTMEKNERIKSVFL